MASRVLQQLLDAQYPTFEQTHPLPDHVRDAVHALRSCRTAALGGIPVKVGIFRNFGGFAEIEACKGMYHRRGESQERAR
jgi:hypothetical protein